MRSIRRTRRPLVALVALIGLLVVGYAVRGLDSGSGQAGPAASAAARSTAAPSTGSGRPSVAGSGVALSTLPAQVSATVRLVQRGGPFPYPRNNGVTFHNNERSLPREADGYYREYTVPTPGSPDRGPRRLVTGRDGEFYYTADHYASFRRVDVTR